MLSLITARTPMAVAWDDQVSIIDGKKIVKRSTHGWELSPTHFRLLSLHLPRKSLIKRHLTGGSAGFSRREIGLSPWLSTGPLDTTNAPTTYIINKATGTTFWCNVIEKEMRNECFAFDITSGSSLYVLSHDL
eukprot:CCRYP_015108-RB/>CCRYP_015108-RB protein AED:0.42 eAED:0.42 QI:0/0/0/1/0/0/3/0/132